MTSDRLAPILHYLRRLAKVSSAGGLTDVQLLERFVASRDEAAFEVLVWRHGPLVLAVCRRVLRLEQDVDDAFQATFLTLSRKASSINRRHAVASWLYKVAYRTALAARANLARCAERERPLDDLTLQAPPVVSTTELRQVLDEEIHHLPERYRIPVVLCYLQGKTVNEAAQELRCPRGTVGTRLARARERLSIRLARRGVTLTAAALASSLTADACGASVPTSLVLATVRSAVAFVTKPITAGAVAAPVISLTQGVLRAMFWSKIKIAAGVIASCVVLGSATGVAYHTVSAAQSGSAKERVALSAGPKTQSQSTDPVQNSKDASSDQSKIDLDKLLADLDEAQYKADSQTKTTAARAVFDAATVIAEQSNWAVNAVSSKDRLYDQLNRQRANLDWVTALEEQKAADRARERLLARLAVFDKGVSALFRIQLLEWTVIKSIAAHSGFSARTSDDTLKLVDLPLAPYPLMVTNGTETHLTDLKEGTRLTLRLAKEPLQVTRLKPIKPRGNPEPSENVVTAIAAGPRILTFVRDNKEWVVPLADDAKILIGAKPAQLADLKPGMRIALTLAAAGMELEAREVKVRQ